MSEVTGTCRECWIDSKAEASHRAETHRGKGAVAACESHKSLCQFLWRHVFWAIDDVFAVVLGPVSGKDPAFSIETLEHGCSWVWCEDAEVDCVESEFLDVGGHGGEDVGGVFVKAEDEGAEDRHMIPMDF